MLDVNYIRQNSDKVKEGAASKNVDSKVVDAFLRLDEEWKKKSSALDNMRSEQNMLNAQMAKNRTEDLMARAQILKQQLSILDKEVKQLEAKRSEVLAFIPNLPFEEVLVGKSDKENKVLREEGGKPNFGFTPKDYLILAEDLNLIDVKRAAKVSGSRFGYILDKGVVMVFGLINMVLKNLTDERFLKRIIAKNKLNLSSRPFIPVMPPVLINKDSMWGMGYFERGKEEIYHIGKDDLYLVGTCEQSIGPMHQGETFEEKELPRRYLGFSSSFRREAGSYGKDTKGILRVHQFEKLEMFSFVKPETSKDEHKFLLAIEEALMKKINIPYRVVEICTGDLGDSAASKYDLEAWMPGQNNGQGEYRETHSASNTTDFQARRLKIKCKPNNDFVHMLNGTAFAFGRILISILENYQTEKGSIVVPKILQSFVGTKEITK